jgi:hypothetical protein
MLIMRLRHVHVCVCMRTVTRDLQDVLCVCPLLKTARTNNIFYIITLVLWTICFSKLCCSSNKKKNEEMFFISKAQYARIENW